MNSQLKHLNIVDMEGNIIGEDTRAHIHAKGLLHREVYVWFYTPQGEVIFQHRSPTKDTFPNLLDATVGGHLDIGEDYISATVREVKEETGVQVAASDLVYLWTFHHRSLHISPSGLINNALRAVYLYRYEGRVADLRIEQGTAVGFEVWSLEKLFNLSEIEKKCFIPMWVEEHGMKIFKKIQELVE